LGLSNVELLLKSTEHPTLDLKMLLLITVYAYLGQLEHQQLLYAALELQCRLRLSQLLRTERHFLPSAAKNEKHLA